MKRRILFVEDNEGLAGVIMRGLQMTGYEVSWVNTTADLDAQLAKGAWNVLLLDLYLGEESTIGRIAGIRAKYPGLKVIVASSEQQGEVIAECLRQGISEHIKKPYDIQELSFKLQKLLPATLAIGKYQLYPETYELEYGGTKETLSAKECQLLRMLAEAEGKVVRYEELYANLGGKKPSEGTIYNLISRIRGLLKKDGKIEIENIKGCGFRMSVRKHTGTRNS